MYILLYISVPFPSLNSSACMCQFAKVNVSIRNGTCKLKRKIAHLVMVTELQNKHREKRKLRKDIWSINVLLSTSLSVIVYNALLHQINIAVKSRIKVIKLRHGRKLHNLKLKQETTNYVDERKQSYIKHTVHNFSFYVMSCNTPLFHLVLIIISQQNQKMLLLR